MKLNELINCVFFSQSQVEFWDKHRDPGYEYPPDSLPGFSNEDYLQARTEGEGSTSLQEGKCRFFVASVCRAVGISLCKMPLPFDC